MIGRVLGNYKILEKLGEGGMGAVFKGVDVMVEREVAIKMLRPEIARQPEIVERFRSEAVTLAKLNHPSIATLFSFFRQGDEFFMVMEFVPGRPLDTLLRDFGPMPVEQAVPVFVKILEGIDHAHKMGILHRDIKPANIMITPAGAVKVTDFGIARIVGAARMTRQGNIVGTLEYIAPERIRGEEHDTRSDLYSLGAVLYEMLCGRLPFETDNEFALMQAHLTAPPPPLNRPGLLIPPEIEAVTMRALAKRAEERFAAAAEFSQALQAAWAAWAARAPKATRVAASLPPPAPTRMATVVPSPAFSPSTKKPAWLLWVAAAIVVVLMASSGAWYVYSQRRIAGANAPGAGQPAASSTPAAHPADPGIPTAGELPGGIEKSPAQQILRNSVPIPVTAQPKPAAKETETKVEPAAISAEERRRAALRALEQGGSDPASAEAKERERKRQEALKALQK